MHGIVDLVPWYDYVSRRGWNPHLLDWLPSLLTGLMLIGTAAVRAKALLEWDALPLVMGAFGWASYLTDSGLIFETGTAHAAFGVLFGLNWVLLGYALWTEGAQ